MRKKGPRLSALLSTRLRRVRHTGDHFRNLTKQWEEALREYLDALAGLTEVVNDKKTR